MKPTLALWLLVATTVLSACGTKDLSPEGFASAAGATCRNANEQLDLIPSPSASPADERQALADYLARALEVNDAAAENILALKIPEGLTAQREELVDAMKDANEGLEEAVDAAADGDDEALAAAVQRMSEGQARFRSIAQRLGITDCLSGGLRGTSSGP